jgi:hypothetical protein
MIKQVKIVDVSYRVFSSTSKRLLFVWTTKFWCPNYNFMVLMVKLNHGLNLILIIGIREPKFCQKS